MVSFLGKRVRTPLRLRHYVWVVATGWTLLVGVVAVAVRLNEENQIEEGALAIARTAYHRDRHWTSLLGTVYVPVTPQVEADLKSSGLPNTIVTTGTGEHLTLLSPAHVRDILSSTSQTPLRIRTRITSMRPSRPENAPDAWEEGALKALEAGEVEASTVADIDGVPHLRFIGALYTEEQCLRCHAAAADRPGTLRGGVSITVSLEPFWSLARQHTSIGMMALVLLWVVGLGGIATGSARVKRRIVERDLAIEGRLRAKMEQERMKSALQESEERYRRIVDTAQEGIWEIDEQGRTTFVNHSMANMLGSTVENMLGRPMYDFMDDTARGEAERNLARRREKVAEQHDFRLRRSDGTNLWTIMSTNPIFDREGNFRGALAIVTDITERMQTEQALSVSESRYRDLFENNSAGVYRTTLDGVIVDCNSAVAGLLGYASPDELKRARVKDFYFDPHEREEFLVALRHTGSLTAYSMRLRRRDGEAIWVLANVTLGETSIQGTLVDVTLQRHAQEALHESEKRLRLEQMRVRIAADLHDEIGSTLSSISVFNEMLRQEIRGAAPRALHLLRRVEDNVRVAQDSLHEIVWTIDPQNDSLENILLKLQQHAVELLEARGIRFESLISEQPVAIALPMEKRRQVYLVIKEALNNLVKHAVCTEAFLDVYVDDGFLALTVRDNGKGFERTAVRTGDGLRNMEARASSIGATLSISSGEALGTSVTIRVPIA